MSGYKAFHGQFGLVIERHILNAGLGHRIPEDEYTGSESQWINAEQGRANTFLYTADKIQIITQLRERPTQGP